MKKMEKHFKKQRNDTDTQVKKYKQDLDAIGIRYDHKSAHVEVPNHATGGFEYFKWDWMTSTTGSHSGIVQIFKDTVRTLNEAKNNPAQYNSLVSSLSASTKSALEATIKSNNITVPTQQASQEELVEKALVELKHCIKVVDITPKMQKLVLALNGEELVAFHKEAIKLDNGITQFNNVLWSALSQYEKDNGQEKTYSIEDGKLFTDNGINHPSIKVVPVAARLALEELKHCIKVVDITPKMQELVLALNGEELVVFHKEAIKLDNGVTQFNNVLWSALNQYKKDNGQEKTYSIEDGKLFADNGINHPSIKVEKAAPVAAATSTETKALSQSGEDSDEDSDDDIEVISKILGSEVTLTNGAKYEVKKIIDLLDKPNFIKQLTNILSKLSPEDSNLVKKEIALKLAYTSNSDMDKYEAVHEIVDNMPQTFIDEFNNYDTLTLDQMRTEEAKILGDGVSYL